MFLFCFLSFVAGFSLGISYSHMTWNPQRELEEMHKLLEKSKVNLNDPETGD